MLLMYLSLLALVLLRPALRIWPINTSRSTVRLNLLGRDAIFNIPVPYVHVLTAAFPLLLSFYFFGPSALWNLNLNVSNNLISIFIWSLKVTSGGAESRKVKLLKVNNNESGLYLSNNTQRADALPVVGKKKVLDIHYYFFKVSSKQFLLLMWPKSLNILQVALNCIALIAVLVSLASLAGVVDTSHFFQI